jgi:5,6-dimethylbenzimidazole synthase
VNADDAIRQRRSVRRYTDAPVSDSDIDAILRLALLAPTGGMAQAWSFLVVRETAKRTALAELVIRGGSEYFRTVRPAAPGTSDEEHAAWARDYAEQALGTYRDVPVWIAGLVVPRNVFPADQREAERTADVASVAFAMENLFVAARARGLGTVPTVFHWFVEDEFRTLLNIPAELEIPLITPLGYPVEFPTSLPPALKAIKRPWKTLVHDDAWGNPRQQA